MKFSTIIFLILLVCIFLFISGTGSLSAENNASNAINVTLSTNDTFEFDSSNYTIECSKKTYDLIMKTKGESISMAMGSKKTYDLIIKKS